MFLQITTEDKRKKDDGKPPKTRSFRVNLLGMISANHLWEGGDKADNDINGYGTRKVRPVLAVVAGLPTTMSPWLANARRGLPSAMIVPHIDWNHQVTDKDSENRVEFMKSANYQTQQATVNEYSVVTLYQRELIALEGAGMVDPEMCVFLALPPMWWIQEQQATVQTYAARLRRWADVTGLYGKAFTSMEHLCDFAALAAYTIAYIDHRTRNPIMADPVYWAHLIYSGIHQGMLTMPQTEARIRGYDSVTDVWHFARQSRAIGYHAVGLDTCGFHEPLACKAPHDRIDALLATTVREFMQLGV